MISEVESAQQVPPEPSRRSRLGRLENQLGFRQLVSDYLIPAESSSIWYLLGGVLAIALGLEIFTGFLLSLVYTPDPVLAFATTKHLIETPGWSVVINFHFYNSFVIFGLVMLHMVRVFLAGGYRRGKQGLWVVGVMLASLTFLISLTGEALHWDEVGFGVPWNVSEFLNAIGLAGAFGYTTDALLAIPTASEKLTQIYVVHVSIVPLLLGAFIAWHYLLIRFKGISTPFWLRASGRTAAFTEHVRGWLIWATIILGVVLLISIFLQRDAGTAPQLLQSSPLFGVDDDPGGLGFKPTFPISWTRGMNIVAANLGIDPDIWGAVVGMALLLGALLIIPFVDGGDREPDSASAAFNLRKRGFAFLAMAVFWVVLIIGVVQSVNGDYTVDPPYISRQRAEDLQKNPLTASTSDKLRYQVGEDGITYVDLQPTTKTGEAVIRFPFLNGAQEIRAWLTPEKRDWILVGLADGTVGYNVVKSKMENAASGEDDQIYRDGRVAFYAKGSIKGEWLLTIAYDSDKNGNRDTKSLYQTIDPNKYYTLYGDATDQRADAASSQTLYLKIERDQFYALFGDYDTGLTVTELSRYSRQFNGLKSEMKSEHFDYTLFASQSDQTFVKDEIQGDGTSGLYGLSRKNIIINSETVVIETRDRFRSEVVLSSQPMSRYADYTIDYDTGTVWFKSPVFSRDANFNPIFIVVRYEVFDTSASSYNYGGRGAVKVLHNKVEVGATGIHEEQNGGKGDLAGMDATVKLDEHTKLRAELSTTKNDENGSATDGSAYLAEVSHRSEKLEGKAYVRELEPGFGLGQQNNSETGTRKTGFDLTYRMGQSYSLQSDAFRQENLTNDAVRDMAELQGKYTEKRYEYFGGVRYAQDTFIDGTTQTSDQIFVGTRYQMTDRLSVTFRHDQSIGNENANTDFPTRTTLGADYKLTDSSTLFASQ